MSENKVGVSFNINVKEIEKARLVSGKKGAYLNATVFINLDQLDEYGNSGMITQDVSKEERDAGTRGPILGNARVFWKSNGQAPQKQSGQSQSNDFGSDDFDDDVPF